MERILRSVHEGSASAIPEIAPEKRASKRTRLSLEILLLALLTFVPLHYLYPAQLVFGTARSACWRRSGVYHSL